MKTPEVQAGNMDAVEKGESVYFGASSIPFAVKGFFLFFFFYLTVVLRGPFLLHRRLGFSLTRCPGL